MGMLLGARRKRPDPPLHSADVRFNIPVPPVKIHTQPVKGADQPLDIINVQPNFNSARRIIEVLRQKVDDAAFLTRRLCAAAAISWQNAMGARVRGAQMMCSAERWVRSIKHECLNHFVTLGGRHLNHLVREYAVFYNQCRPHSGRDHLSSMRAVACPPKSEPDVVRVPMTPGRGLESLKHEAQTTYTRTDHHEAA